MNAFTNSAVTLRWACFWWNPDMLTQLWWAKIDTLECVCLAACDRTNPWTRLSDSDLCASSFLGLDYQRALRDRWGDWVSFFSQQTVALHHGGAEDWSQGSGAVNAALSHILKLWMVANAFTKLWLCEVSLWVMRRHPPSASQRLKMIPMMKNRGV